jgi:hypothetical protein
MDTPSIKMGEKLHDLKQKLETDNHVITLNELYSHYHNSPVTGMSKATAQKILEHDELNALTHLHETPEWIV